MEVDSILKMLDMGIVVPLTVFILRQTLEIKKQVSNHLTCDHKSIQDALGALKKSIEELRDSK